MSTGMVIELPAALVYSEIVMLDEAHLCESCRAISPAPHGACLKCGSRALAALESLVNRAAKRGNSNG